MAEGENTLPATQTVNGVESDAATVKVIVNPLETPVANPAIAGGAGILALIGAGVAFTRRKRPQA